MICENIPPISKLPQVRADAKLRVYRTQSRGFICGSTLLIVGSCSHWESCGYRWECPFCGRLYLLCNDCPAFHVRSELDWRSIWREISPFSCYSCMPRLKSARQSQQSCAVLIFIIVGIIPPADIGSNYDPISFCNCHVSNDRPHHCHL